MNRRKALAGLAAIVGGSIAANYVYRNSKNERINSLRDEKLLIGELAETIIPRTDTPGAKDVNAAETIILLLEDCADRKTQNNFIRGLEKIKSQSESSYYKSFFNCTLKEKELLLVMIENEEKPFNGFVGKIKNKFFGESFIFTLKEYTSNAYCSSMKGAQEGLQYVMIPGKRIACVSREKNGKSWATQ